MTFNEFKQELFRIATESGCEAAELYSVTGEKFAVNILNGEVEDYVASKSEYVNLRVKVGGKDGYAYTEVMSDADSLVRHAMDNARSIENTDESPMQKHSEYENIPSTYSRLAQMSASERIEYAKKLETATLAQDKSIVRLANCKVICTVSSLHICNTLGLDASCTNGLDFCYVAPVMTIGDETHNHYEFVIGEDIFDIEKLASNAAKNCKRKFGGTPVAPGEYNVMIENMAMIDLLSCFTGVFSADAAQKGLSLLAGKENTTIAAPCVTLIDDAWQKICARSFDDEGVPTYKKNIIEDGVLKTLLYNNKAAKKAGIASTGNASRSTGAVGVSPNCMYLAPSDTSYDDMIKKLGDGIVIFELGNIMSGSNEVSGEFSLSAKGFLVKDGVFVKTVDKITIAGSFFELLKNITYVGSDLKLLPAAIVDVCALGAPSVIISKLMVAGDA